MKNVVAAILSLIMVCTLLTPVYSVDDDYDDIDLLAVYSPHELVNLYHDAANHLAEELRALNSDISFEDYNFTEQNIDSLYKAVYSENPDLFYVSPSAFETTSSLSDGKVVALRPYYMFKQSAIPSKIEAFEAAADYFLKGVNPAWDDMTKVRYLHDIVAHYVEYELEDYSDSSIYTAYGALINGRAVCEGYTLALNYLLSRVGVEAHYIRNKVESHAWSMVTIDGEYYHVDVTQDDASYDNLGRVNHTYCIVSDSALCQGDYDTDHAAWVSGRKAGSTRFDNAWWRNINTMIYRIGRNDYYVNQHYGSSIYGGIKCRDASTGQQITTSVLQTRWYVKGLEGAFWERAYVYLTYDGKYLYFNDANTVYRQVPGSEVSFAVYNKPSTLKNDIYGVAFKPDGSLYVTIKTDPNSPDKIYKLDIKAVNEYDFSEPEPVTEPEQTDPTETYPDAPTESVPDVTEPSETAETTKPTNPTEPKTDGDVVKKKLTLYVAQQSYIKAQDAGKVTYSSSKKSVASVTKKGVITAKKKGKAVITAKGKFLTAKITVTVKNPRLSATSLKVKKGKKVKLKIIGGVGSVNFKSSNRKVVSLNSSGAIIAKRKGKATITLTTNGGIKLKCKITVT